MEHAAMHAAADWILIQVRTTSQAEGPASLQHAFMWPMTVHLGHQCSKGDQANGMFDQKCLATTDQFLQLCLLLNFEDCLAFGVMSNGAHDFAVPSRAFC